MTSCSNICYSKKRLDLTVRVNITSDEVREIYNAAIKKAEDEYYDVQYSYYKIYLRHLFGPNSTAPIDDILKRLHSFRDTIEHRISMSEYTEEWFVRGLITRNEYDSKSEKRPGVTVKLFRTYYNNRDVMVKTYVYDGECPSLDDRIMATFKDEVLFQYYANRLRTSFISPELYSWGQIRRYQFIGDKYFYKCLYLIMENIPGVTLANATYTGETMKYMYERVKKADAAMIAAGIHHNDLHGGNVMLCDKLGERCNEKSPLPEIVILDFGEASFGPRKPLFTQG